MRIILLLMISMVVGCTSIPRSGSIFSAEVDAIEDKAIVHFYRPSTFFMSVVEVNVFINEKPELVLSSGTYSTKYLDPGKYHFKAKEKPNRYGRYSAVLGDSIYEFEYELEAGKTYYAVWYPSVAVLSGKYEENFIISNLKNPYSPIEGVLTDIQAEFGVVSSEFGVSEISKTNQSNSVVDLERI